jgi:transposase
MKQTIDQDGYPHVNLKRNRIAVHRLVLIAFVGPNPPGQMCRHLDGNPANNCVGNLAWGTYLENAADRAKHGKNLNGEKNHLAKLTEDDVRAIRRDYKSGGVTHQDLADRYGISKHLVYLVIKRKMWRHIECSPAEDLTRKNCAAKLDAEKVKAIRDEFAAGGVSKREIALRYGVSDALIGCIVRRKFWRHVA